MSNPIESSSQSFVSRVVQNEATKKAAAGLIAGVLVAIVSEALFGSKT